MTDKSLAVTRAVIGLAQGAALYLLCVAFDIKIWPVTKGLLFAPLVLVVVFVPSLAAAGLGNLRRRAFAIWIAAAIVVLAVLGAYDIFHDPNGGFVGGSTAPRNLPSALRIATAFARHCGAANLNSPRLT